MQALLGIATELGHHHRLVEAHRPLRLRCIVQRAAERASRRDAQARPHRTAAPPRILAQQIVQIASRLSVRQIDRNVASHRVHRLRNWAAAIVLVLIGSAVGWTGRDYLTPVEAAPDRLIEEAVNAHTLYVREKTHAVEVPAGAPNLMTWLSNRIAVAFDAPDLSAHGYRFIGGRLLPGYGEGAAQGPAAQLMYENDSSQRLTLYVTAPLPDKKEVWEFKTIGTAEAYYWANDAVTCTIVASLPEAEVRLLGKAVFEQLTRRPDSTWNRNG
jgi:anti-sigma factor RsiW